MGWLATIGAALQLVLLVFKRWIEKDAERKKRMKEAEDEVKSGIKKRDASAVTRGFSRVNRL
jgi:hypothetical protein